LYIPFLNIPCDKMSGAVKITTVDGKNCEGSIFCIDPVTNTVVLKTGGNNDSGCSYVMINSTQITQIDGNAENITLPNLALMIS